MTWPRPSTWLSVAESTLTASGAAVGVGLVAGPPRCCLPSEWLRGWARAQHGRYRGLSIDPVATAVNFRTSLPSFAASSTFAGCRAAAPVVPFQQRLRHWSHVLWVCGSLFPGWVVMGRGSGALAATIVVSASSLAFGRVGGIVRHRVRSAGASPSVVFGKSNQRLEQAASASLRRLLRRSVLPRTEDRSRGRQ